MKALEFTNDWRVAPHPLSLRTGEVHIWRASLDLEDADVLTLTHTLSLDEQKRARRFHFVRDQRRFVAGRGILRSILNRYTGLDSSQIQFSYGPNGKPALVAAPGAQRICFNLSHSDRLALYAVALNTEVGIDVERIQPGLADVIESFFTSGEAASLRALPREAQPTAFFNCWTAKEAYLKAHGRGIADGFGNFEVSLSPAGLISRVVTSPEDFSLCMLAPDPQYVAALVIQGTCGSLDLFDWNFSYLQEQASNTSRRQDFHQIGELIPDSSEIQPHA